VGAGATPVGVSPTNEALRTDGGNCYANGESSLAVRKELAAGAVLVSMLGYTVAYNTLDNNRNPTAGTYAEFKQDFAGIGGDVNFIRTTADSRSYYEMFSDVVAVLHLQGGHIAGWGGKDVRMLDHFQMGPNLVRGFAPSGLGPRDLQINSNTGFGDPLGGTLYWGASLEAQAPFSFLPKDAGLKGAVFADAGSLWDYKGPTFWNVTGETLTPQGTDQQIRASVGVGLIWNSPFGPLRFDYAFPLAKQGYDRIQQFRFGGGTKF
jgi:outer membrane protein insertion porin family